MTVNTPFKCVKGVYFMKRLGEFYKTNKLIILASVILGIFWLTIFSLSAATGGEDGVLANQVIRFHILAENDSLEEQELKNALRDYLRPIVGHYVANSNSVSEARELILANLQYIENAAQAFANNLGSGHNIEARLVSSLAFPTMSYGGFIMPQGNYEALQIVIGDGQGQNWWCVLFPPICIADVMKVEDNDIDQVIMRPRFWVVRLFGR